MAVDVAERDLSEQLDDQTSGALAPGTKVEVRSRFDQSWSRGFEIIEAADDGFRLRRLSDGAELPVTFAADDLRPERRRKQGMWWY